MYTYVYICMYINMYTCICTNVYAQMYRLKCIDIYIYIYMYVHVHYILAVEGAHKVEPCLLQEGCVIEIVFRRFPENLIRTRIMPGADGDP